MKEPKFFYMESYEDGSKLKLWSRKGVEIIDTPFKPYCYIPASGSTGFKDAGSHLPLQKKEFSDASEVHKFKYAVGKTWEADVDIVRRVMIDMDWKISDVPKAYVDIETDDTNGASKAETDPIICIGIIFDDGREVYLKGDEEKMLDDFIDLMQNVGMIITYNGGTDIWQTRAFDLPYLSKRYHDRYQFDKKLRHCAFIDLYHIYKYEVSRVGKSLAGGYSLENVCQHELGEGKVQHTEKFAEMSPEKLKEYNLQDIRLLKRLDEKFLFTELKIDLARLTHLSLVSWRKNKKWDETKPLIMVDQLLLDEGKDLGLIWRNRNFDQGEAITGAMVFNPMIGVHDDVQNYDIKQMYPSIMINERVSPDKDRVVIPNILKRLKTMRAKFKAKYEKTKRKEDFITQYNYKVLANIFYGALANPSCRVYDRDLAQFVTSKGRKILTEISEIAKALGYDTLYGDTDSVFLQVQKEKVQTLKKIINRKITPYEVEDGEFYKSILFVGDEAGGTKKRYAGLEDNGTLKVVGMEAVKRDYTVMAREMQILILLKLLNGVDVRDCQKCIRNLHYNLSSGVYDQYLVITKGVKELSEYKIQKTKDGKEHRMLPHVRALKMAVELGHQNMYDVSFVYTKDDVAPVIAGDTFPKDIDYERYFQRQISAVVEPLLTSVQIQNGTYVRSTRKIARKTVSKSILDYVSS